jgi:hypothetical protein
MEFPTTLLFGVTADLASIKPKFRCRKDTSFGPIRNSSSHRQLLKIVTFELLVGFTHMGSHRKGEKVGYKIGIESFWRLHSKWSQTFKYLSMHNSTHNRISAARSTSKLHNS